MCDGAVGQNYSLVLRYGVPIQQDFQQAQPVRMAIQDGGCFLHVIFDGDGQMREKTAVLLLRMFFLDLLHHPSLGWVHVDVGHELVPTHAFNKGSPLSFSISQNDQWDVECG
jgi:hypothetical protein